jgi:hypothetical protein
MAGAFGFISRQLRMLLIETAIPQDGSKGNGELPLGETEFVRRRGNERYIV